jgi:hypothetical protein
VIAPMVAAWMGSAVAVVLELFPTSNPAVTPVHEGGFFLYLFGCLLVIGTALTFVADW